MNLKNTRSLNKSAPVGTFCVCPACGVKFIKETYQQVFCKTKGGTVCKDKYWNTVTPTKRNNTTRISPANRRYYNNVIAVKREDADAIEALGMDFLLDCGSRD